MTEPRDVLNFWFGADHSLERPDWFQKSGLFDAEIRRRFGADVETAIAGGLVYWEMTSDGALALIVLLDQFPRNIYRGTAQAFAGDHRSRSVAHEAIRRGLDKNRTAPERQFFYLPFTHSERLIDQDRSVELVAALGDPDLLKWAIAHRDIILRFGRFPHRNDVLGRPSTPEEIEFLMQPGSSF